MIHYDNGINLDIPNMGMEEEYIIELCKHGNTMRHMGYTGNKRTIEQVSACNIYLVGDPNIPRRVRTSCPKKSVTETCVGTFFSDTKHNDEKNINHKIRRRQSTSNDVVDDVSVPDNTNRRRYSEDDPASISTMS